MVHKEYLIIKYVLAAEALNGSFSVNVFLSCVSIADLNLQTGDHFHSFYYLLKGLVRFTVSVFALILDAHV